jgi:hypothetical protein
MNDCRRLTERIPAVALGRGRWAGEEEAHLGACADCRAEWELVRAAGRIGAGLPPLADRPEIAAAVLRRVAARPMPDRRRRTLRWAGGLAAAAGVTLAVWSSLGREPAAPSAAVAADETAVAPLSTAQVDSLLDADVPLAGWSMLETPALGDLNTDELERLLRTWEG